MENRLVWMYKRTATSQTSRYWEPRIFFRAKAGIFYRFLIATTRICWPESKTEREIAGNQAVITRQQAWSRNYKPTNKPARIAKIQQKKWKALLHKYVNRKNPEKKHRELLETQTKIADYRC
jgi:hypothetical protein